MDVPTDQQPEVFIVSGGSGWKRPQRLHRLADVGLDSYNVSGGFSCQSDRQVGLIFELHDL